MNNATCPYTCQPVATIDASREHIIPDALGGANAFALVADRGRNGLYGEGVDSRLIHSPMVSLSATRHGIETRSGEATTRERGVFLADASPVDATFLKDEVRLRMRSPVVHDENGNLVAVRGFGDAAQKELKRLELDFKKKGRSVIAGEPTALEPEVRVRLAHNHDHVRQGLAKIAYLATTWTLGDAFISTAAGALFRSYIDALPVPEALKAVGLLAIPTNGLKQAMPELPDHYHVIVCMRNGAALTTTVRLFNQDLLTTTFCVQTPELPSSPARTRVITVDATAKTFEEAEYPIA